VALQNDIVEIFGKSGCGKSFFAGWLASKFKERGKARLVIWDKKNEYRGLASSLLVLNQAAFAKVQQAKHEFFIRLLADHPSVRVVPQGLTLNEMLESYNELAHAIYELGDTVLLTEEAHVVCPQGQTPRYAQILVTDARTDANDLIFVTQRAQNLDTTIVSQGNVRVTFKLTDPNDLKRVSTFFENPAPGEYSNVGAFIAGMQPFVALYVDEKNGFEGVIHTSKITDFAHFG
jgi:DNA helicase HerA-like ATPase